ncbi:hypothetical protein [Mesorhizobium sp. LSJC285A00]|uniref:hypothetical protein n=1 Tax=Mesorhizobium sp. LSJC285A00 TaxID=1287338 RepID=UPI001FD8DBB5|nr:hypothetical protein [Mesorhizobium sp. LSJC285A00]
MHPAGGVDDRRHPDHRQNDGGSVDTKAVDTKWPPGGFLRLLTSTTLRLDVISGRFGRSPSAKSAKSKMSEPSMRIVLCTAFLGLAAASLSPASAAADDCGDAAALVQQAYPKAQKSADGASFTLEPHTSIAQTLWDGDAPFGVVCKIWPAHDDLLLVAVPLIDSSQSSDDGHFGDVELLVVDRKTRQVRQRLLQPGLMTDDAVGIREIDFDTGRYRLAPDVGAFGLRIDMATHSQPNPFSETDLRLYALDGGALRLVLDGIIVAGFGGEGDTNCAGSFQSNRVSLAMSPARHHGYHDITVFERLDTDNPSVDKNGECQSHPGRSMKRTYRLRYDGRRYQFPAGLKALEPE